MRKRNANENDVVVMGVEETPKSEEKETRAGKFSHENDDDMKRGTTRSVPFVDRFPPIYRQREKKPNS